MKTIALLLSFAKVMDGFLVEQIVHSLCETQ